MVSRWKNVRNIILRKRCKSQKNTYSKVPLMYNVKIFKSLHENNKYQFRILASFRWNGRNDKQGCTKGHLPVLAMLFFKLFLFFMSFSLCMFQVVQNKNFLNLMYIYFHLIPLLGIYLTYVLAYAQACNNIYKDAFCSSL